MGEQLQGDGFVVPPCMSQNLDDYSAVCEKFNQSIRILWRQRLSDESMPSIPEDHGAPVCTVYGTKATLKMRGIQNTGLVAKELVQTMYGDGMDARPIQSRNWSYNAAMMREGETPVLAEDVAVQVWERNPVVPGFNEQLRESSEIVANVDIGFR
jgi:hypothetical protein